MMGTVIALFIIDGFLILCSPISIGRFVARKVSGRSAWIQPALVLIGPFIAAFGFVILVWLPAFTGQCGGWLGETTSCGFGRYATETIFWAAMSMAMPALLGILHGFVVLIVGWIRRNMSR
jgi:hypothetical protein